jgi:glycerol-3-phosphate O-acyltransferase/dihydroxyacetone phosphate acyltransferase
MKKAVVGFFARSLHSIPVVRALDAASPGVGTVSISGKNVTGNGTNFTKQLEKGFSIFVNGMEDPIRVDDITSDTEAILSQPFECQNSKWKCIPKLDHSGVYDVVFERLGQGRCVGIFPEGGSHDRTQLLPLKAGVTLMALGAMDKYNIPVTIVPVGLNYFSGHRFRSHVLVEFGKAYQIPNDTLLQYRKNKREACSSLLGQVERSMRTVTMNAPDFDTLRAIHTIRRLYQPSSKTLTSDQYLELNRRFAAAYIKFKDFPQIQAVESRIKDYNLRLDMLGVKDLHVAAADTMGSTFMFLVALVLRFALLVGLAVVALPGIILISPIGLLAKIISIRKAKQALRSSTVKLKGTDVIASYKVRLLFLYFFRPN